MKSTTKFRLNAIGASLLTVALLAGCAGGGSNEPVQSSSNTPVDGGAKKAPTTISIISPDLGRVWKADNPGTKELEERTNVKLNVSMHPNNDFTSKYNVLAASGDIPDISRLSAFDYQNFADQGLFLDLTDYIDEYGPNLRKAIPAELWELTQYKGKQFVIPYENTAGKEVPVVRGDWLEALGLDLPTNLDEFEAMLKAFTFDDPDQNGVNDTYGMGVTNTYSESFMPIFGAHGIAPGFIGGSTPMPSFVKGDQIVPVAVSPEYKASIAYIKRLWDAKVIDPEIFTIKADQAQQKAAQGKIGYFNAWWSIAPQQLVMQLKMNEIVPEAKWDPIFPGLTGPEGKSGMFSFGNIGASVAISAKSKHPEEAIRFLDYLATEEGWELARFGLKGEHYTSAMEPRTAEGQKAYDEKWLDPLSQIVSRVDLVDQVNNASEDPVQIENNRFINAAASYTLYQDVFYGIPHTDEYKTYGADVAKFEEEMIIKFITGVESLDNWDDYMESWKKKGGQTVFEASLSKYNELRGTQMKSGL